ncbi:hypothetical protein N5853_09305 [Bartonella sp. HY329]|uniref:hypothetical protein n=1 Tax=unclassified Bartonella TaxID=2645622 RepID=UPI0021C8F259|nr:MULTISPECIES: hypothetical protein [unclassified Bartonella]UXM94303.1 hypothetical protein N5853_09305 [Bartonella sp. HY329]UXN08626.1 hypothetical protein N5852_09315 [Bartonella sp. HY328]
MSSDKWNSVWGAVKAKWAYIKPKLKTAWAIICDVVIELYKPIKKIANRVYGFASQSPVLIAASAIIACVVMIIICSVAYSFLFSTTLSFDRFSRISFGVTALFTLGVVVWRGILHSMQEKTQSEQANIAADQIMLANKQFGLASNNFVEMQKNNLAKLFVDGTKLLGRDATAAEKNAGVSCLSYIVALDNSFALEAKNVLQMFIQMTSAANPKGINIDNDTAIVNALDAINSYAFHHNELINFDGLTIWSAAPLYSCWSNFLHINYVGVEFCSIDFNGKESMFETQQCIFDECIIDSLQRLNMIPELVYVYDAKTGLGYTEIRPCEKHSSHFVSCKFDGGEKSNDAFRGIDKPEYRWHTFDNCIYSDKWFTSTETVAFFKDKGVESFSEYVKRTKKNI